MKIGKKLIIGFMAIASLVGLVGIFSALSHNNIQANSRITTEVLELRILVNKSLVELLALNQTENIKDYVRAKSDYEQIRAEFDALFRKLGEEIEKRLQVLGINLEAFHEDADRLARISNRLIALHKRKLARSKEFEEKKRLERQLRRKIHMPVLDLKDLTLTDDIGFLQYHSKETLFQYKDQEHLDQWLERIQKIKNNPLVAPLPNILNDLNAYERVAQDLSKIVVEQETIETQEHLVFGKLQELIDLLEENNERIANKVKVESQALTRNTQLFMFAVAVAAFLVSIILGLAIARSVSKPVANLAQITQAIAQGDFSVRLNITSADEIGELATSFDRMAEDLQKSTTSIDNLNREITERKKVEKQIEKSLEEKVVLLREVHHRVKNNMQIILSLLRLQSGIVKDKEAIDTLKEYQNRVRSMVLVHEESCQSEGLINIDFAEYTKKLTNSLVRSYGIDSDKIMLKTNIDDVGLDLNSAIPCGLIVNELISNALRYAFGQDGSGEIRVFLRKDETGRVELIVGDNGIGIGKDLDFRQTESLGLQLVTILAEEQLEGEIEVDVNAGTDFKITFKPLTSCVVSDYANC